MNKKCVSTETLTEATAVCSQTQFYLVCVNKELILDQPSTFDIKMSEYHTGLPNRKSLWKKGWFRLSQFKLLPSDLITVFVWTQVGLCFSEVDSAVTHFTKTKQNSCNQTTFKRYVSFRFGIWNYKLLLH